MHNQEVVLRKSVRKGTVSLGSTLQLRKDLVQHLIQGQFSGFTLIKWFLF